MTDEMEGLEEITEIETHEEWALRRKREAMKVSRPQAVHALRQAGLIPAIEAYMGAASDLERDAWENAVIFSRLSPLVQSMAAALGISDAQLDMLFEAAAQVAI